MRNIPMREHVLFEVRLVVAVPIWDNNSERVCSALDGIVPAVADEFVMLDMKETRLSVVEVTTPEATRTETTTPVLSFAGAVKAKAKTTRKRKKSAHKYRANKRWTLAEKVQLHDLYIKGHSLTHIANALGRTQSAVANEVWRQAQAKKAK